MTTKKTLIEFPCNFPIKIIGNNSLEFLQEIKLIAIKHFPMLKSDDLIHKTSQNSSYLSITVTVFAENQLMLDEFYREVTRHPDVKMVL